MPQNTGKTRATRVAPTDVPPQPRPSRDEAPRGRRRPTRGMRVDPGDWLLRSGVALASALSRYHRHQVVHLERLETLFREGRRVILVGNHALDVVDPLLLLATVYRKTGRVPRFVGHEKGWFRLPLVRDFSKHFEVIPSRRFGDTVTALRRDGFLMLYPGGVRESGMRSYRDEPYRLKWDGRMGFLRAALKADAEIVFVAAVGNEEAYYQSRLPTPGAVLQIANGKDERYDGMPLRLGLLGTPHVLPGVFPVPVRITHFISEPLDLGDRDQALANPDALRELHGRVWRHCQGLLDVAVRQRAGYSDLLDQTIRSGQRVLQYLGF